jgi:4-nitrophenyl phosphatase
MNDIKGFLIDLDGVIVKGKNFEIFEDAVYFFKILKKNYIPFKITTNNSRYPPFEIAKRLKEKGISLKEKDIVSPLSIAPEVFNQKNIKSLYIVGAETLKDYMKTKGFKILNSFEVDAVLIGLDKNFNFQKMKIATTAIKKHGAELFALNKNLISQDEEDKLLFPGVGSVATMFANACSIKEYQHFGKGSKLYNKYVFDELSLPLDRLAIISDDLYTDLYNYKKYGLKTIFMTTGKYTISDIKSKDLEPDFIFNSLTELMENLGLK